MKILQIIPNLKKGGAERIVLDICNELRNYPNITLKLVTFDNSNQYAFLSKNIDLYNIPSSFTPSLTRKSTVNTKELQKFIDNFNPDIIHSHLWESEFILSQISFKNVIWFSHFHSNMAPLDHSFSISNKRKFTDYYEKHIVLNSYKKKKKRFITISNDTNNYAQKVLPDKFKTKICLLKNAINYSTFFNPKKKTLNSTSEIKLISVGSLVKKKNHIFLIHVIKHLKNLNINSTLTILGDGPERLPIEQLINEFNLENNVFLKGKVDNVSSYLHSSDIYVHSATYEPFGLVLLEAMAAGLPVISLDGMGNRDIINNGKNGFILSEKKHDLFANQIINLINDEKLFNKIQLNAWEYSKNFDIKQYVQSLLKLYQEEQNND